MKWIAVLAIFAAIGSAQTPEHPRKKLLVIGEEKGYRHEAVSHAMATIERLGHDTGLWDTFIRTDTEALTKKKLEYNAKNLNDFDAVVFYTGGNLEMDDSQKADFLSFVHDDGKGFFGIHCCHHGGNGSSVSCGHRPPFHRRTRAGWFFSSQILGKPPNPGGQAYRSRGPAKKRPRSRESSSGNLRQP